MPSISRQAGTRAQYTLSSRDIPKPWRTLSAIPCSNLSPIFVWIFVWPAPYSEIDSHNNWKNRLLSPSWRPWRNNWSRDPWQGHNKRIQFGAFVIWVVFSHWSVRCATSSCPQWLLYTVVSARDHRIQYFRRNNATHSWFDTSKPPHA